ncbi:hypothetical protein EBZ39_02240 [bacterium]|nr:hypothetical protein [bacterium]
MNGVTPLFVFCADLHLEDGAWSTRPGIYGDAYYSFQQIIDYCIAQNLPLIMGGDILEKKQNLARPIAKLCEGLSRLQQKNVRAYYIQGNHEYDRNAPWLSVHPWPIHLHDTGVQFGDACIGVWGLDWLPRGEIQAALQQVPADTDILITHQVWKDFMGTLGRTECELSDVHHVQTVLAGDFHVTKTVEGVNAQGKPVQMLSPGSTAMQDIGETPEKYFFVIGVENNSRKLVFQPVQLKTRRFAYYVVRDLDTLDELCAGKLIADIKKLDGELPAEINKPLIRIKFDKQLPDAYLRLITAIGDSAHVFCDVINDRDTANQVTDRKSGRNDLLSVLAELLPENSVEYGIAVGLLAAEDPVKALDAQFSKFIKDGANAVIEVGSQELGAPSSSSV